MKELRDHYPGKGDPEVVVVHTKKEKDTQPALRDLPMENLLSGKAREAEGHWVVNGMKILLVHISEKVHLPLVSLPMVKRKIGPITIQTAVRKDVHQNLIPIKTGHSGGIMITGRLRPGALRSVHTLLQDHRKEPGLIERMTSLSEEMVIKGPILQGALRNVHTLHPELPKEPE
jgi:hypothetical protein